MIDRLAKRYGLKLYETPVGFNHIADYMMTEDVLIGGEESGGISIQGTYPEGDGPIMGLLLVEMIAASGKTLHEPGGRSAGGCGSCFLRTHRLALEPASCQDGDDGIPDETGPGRDRNRKSR